MTQSTTPAVSRLPSKIGTTIGQTETPNCFCSLCNEV